MLRFCPGARGSGSSALRFPTLRIGLFHCPRREIDIEDNAAEYIASLSDGDSGTRFRLSSVFPTGKGVITVDTAEEVVYRGYSGDA